MKRSKKAGVFLALDVNTKEEAFSLVEKWSGHIEGFKVGPRIGFQLSKSEWAWLADKGSVFIDYKFFDIPSTVESSVQVAFDSGASFCTVHAMNGLECLKRLLDLESKLNKVRPFKVLVVTLLTSFDQDENTLPLVGKKKPEEIVKDLAALVFESGLSALVCSAQEVSMLKKAHPGGVFVTPGIRFESDSVDDQKRVASPGQAWSDGATYLVMGRSLIRAADVKQAIQNLEDSWQTV